MYACSMSHSALRGSSLKHELRDRAQTVDKEDVIKNWNVDREFEPAMEEAERNAKIEGWKKAVKCSFGWAKES